MVDLKTTYLGLELKNPLVLSASPLSERIDLVRDYEQAGVSAIVMYSLFEEQITQESLMMEHYENYGTDSFAEALSFFPDTGRYAAGPESYLDHLRALKDAVDIPVIASLNGISSGKWIEYAERIEASGADALELNLYSLPVDPDKTASDYENDYVELVRNVRMAIKIPLTLKLSPFFSSLPNIAKQFSEAGANGLVLFNRFYQPDFDLKNLEVVPNLQLSTSAEIRLPLRWIALLYGKVDLDFALTTGVHTGEDIVKAMMAGAKATLVASEFLQHGASRAAKMLDELRLWMEEKEYESIEMMQGAMCQDASGDPSIFERANYAKVLNSFNNLS